MKKILIAIVTMLLVTSSLTAKNIKKMTREEILEKIRSINVELEKEKRLGKKLKEAIA